MRAGRLDRRITVQRKSIAHSDSGQEVVTWQDVAEVWAEKVENRGEERFAAQQLVGHAIKTFRIRWSSVVDEITTEHRLTFDGREYDITDVREIGRRDGLELDAFAPSEIAVTP